MSTEPIASKKDEMEVPPETWRRLQKVLWRDFLFLVLGGVALNIVGYIETHANDTDIRGGGSDIGAGDREADGCPGTEIVDAGFLLTTPLHTFLANNRDWNDALACINSIVLFIPAAYAAKVTLWRGDFTLSFRLISMYLFRSFCGWFTYLPPDPGFLMSYYDFPEVVQCLYKDCSAEATDEVLPFVSFFSGHVACTVIAANHMYLNRANRRAAVVLHVFNVLQMVRLLATRGHYSIDIIIGWAVAVYVSNPAERLGRYYTRGVTLKQLLLPRDVTKALETITGVSNCKNERNRKLSVVFDSVAHIESEMIKKELEREMHSPERSLRSETTARIAVEIATKFAQQNLSELQSELNKIGMRLQEVRKLDRDDVVELLTMAQMDLTELHEQAKKHNAALVDGMSRMDILDSIMREMIECHNSGAKNKHI